MRFSALRFVSFALFSLIVLWAFSYRVTVQKKSASSSEPHFSAADFGKLPLNFEPNHGQATEPVRFLSRGSGYTLFLTPEETVLKLRRQSRSEAVMRMRLENANSSPALFGEEEQGGKSNYFIGSDPERWYTDIPHFARVRYKDVYPGIDQVFYGNGRQLEYDFVVAPGADPSQISLKFDGVEKVGLDNSGELVISIEDGEIRHLRPVVFQEDGVGKKRLGGNYVLLGDNKIGFELEEYDRTKELIIDPVLVYSTYLGGNGADSGRGIAIDPGRNVYVTGQASSTNFPTVNPIQPNLNGTRSDIFVTKINAAGNAIVYSTYIGGSVGDIGNGIDVDNAGNAYVTGVTGGTLEANDFPTTPGAFDRTFNTPDEAVLLKINAAGSALVYSTYTGALIAFEVKVDKTTGEAFIAGNAGSILPTTPGAFRTTCQPTPCSGNGFITKFNASASALVYSTYIGPGIANDLAIDAAGNAYVVGSTISNFFPITPGAAQPTCTGCNLFRSDAFVMKMNAAGSAPVYSTYLGGSIDDVGFGIAVDGNGNAYVTGRTESSSAATVPFPTTPGAYQTTSPGIPDGFVTKVNPAGSAFVYSTFLGGNVRDESFGIAVDPSGNAHVIGQTRSGNFPMRDAVQSTCTINGPCVSITSLNSVGSDIVFSTFFGQGMGLENVADNVGNIYVTGETYEGLTNLPTMNPIQPNHGSGNSSLDAFVAKVFIQPVGSTAFDFDGDRKTDVGIARNTGSKEWWINRSTAGLFATPFGVSSDVIAPADFTGDGKTDIASFRPSDGNWYVLRSEDLTFYAFPFGANGDVPVPGDFDGDGKADATVFRPSNSTWYQLLSGGGSPAIGFGAAGDKPVVADYDGDGKSDIAIFRPSGGSGSAEWWIQRSTAGLFAVAFGSSTDKAVPGDYTGDGKTDVAFWRPSSGEWYVLRSENLTFFAFPWGATGDIPAPGDYDGDGKHDASIFRPSEATWYINRTTGTPLITAFGANGDRPIPNAFVP